MRDLDRSVAFLESFTALGRRARWMPATTARPYAASRPLPGLRLVQWHTGRRLAAPTASGRSWVSPGSCCTVADLDAARSRARSRSGIVPVAPTTGDDFRFELGSAGNRADRVWSCLDPDGTSSNCSRTRCPRSAPVAQGTADLATAREFLTGVLGARPRRHRRDARPRAQRLPPGGDPVEFRGVFLRVPGEAARHLDVLEHRPGARAPNATTPPASRVVHVALEVDDVDAARDPARDTVARRAGRLDGQVAEVLRRSARHPPRARPARPEGVRYRLVEAG